MTPLLPNHAALHRQNPNQQGDPNSPNTPQISPSDAVDIYKYTQGDYPGKGLLDMFRGGPLVSEGSSTGAAGPIASPGLLSGLGWNGAGWGSAAGGAASEAGVAPVAGGLSNAPTSSAGLMGSKGSSGAGAAGGAGLMGPLGIIGVGLATAYMLDKKHNKDEKAKAAKEAQMQAEMGDQAYAQYQADMLAKGAAYDEAQRKKAVEDLKQYNQPTKGD